MSIENGDMESITESDLQELVDAGVPESLRLDYKLTAYGKSDSDKRELAKDISAMANTNGGHLLLGVEEKEGFAKFISGLDIDCDAEILRIEQITRNTIEPTISGIRIRQIKLANGKNVIVIRIPRSWNPPHRVTAQGINRFFLRHSAGVHEPSIDELRTMFNQSESVIKKAKQFHSDRIYHIIQGETERPLVGNGRLIFHLVPIAAFSGTINIDLEKAHELHQAFRPLASSGMNFLYNFHGYRTERGGSENHGYTQIFRNGALEATQAGIVRNHDDGLIIPGQGVERKFFELFESFINGLRDLGVPTPLVALITLEGVSGARYKVHDSYHYEEAPLITDDRLSLPACVIEDYGVAVDYHKVIRPAFDSLWNATGYSKSQFFSESGVWVGPHN